MYLSQNKLKPWREENTPEYCPLLGIRDFKPVVDHDHETGLVRGVISSEANTLLGRVERAYKRLSLVARTLSLPEILRRIADFLEQNTCARTGYVLHPVGLNQLCKRFKNNYLAEEQIEILEKLGAKKDEIYACTNADNRTKLFRSVMKVWSTKAPAGFVHFPGSSCARQLR
jgi:hypothetical protein